MRRNCIPPMTHHPVPGSTCCSEPLPSCAEIDAFDLGQQAGGLKLPPQTAKPNPATPGFPAQPSTPTPPAPGWTPCPAGLEGGWRNPENGICIPQSVLDETPRDFVCSTSTVPPYPGGGPGGGPPRPGVQKKRCCGNDGYGSGFQCFTEITLFGPGGPGNSY